MDTFFEQVERLSREFARQEQILDQYAQRVQCIGTGRDIHKELFDSMQRDYEHSTKVTKTLWQEFKLAAQSTEHPAKVRHKHEKRLEHRDFTLNSRWRALMSQGQDAPESPRFVSDQPEQRDPLVRKLVSVTPRKQNVQLTLAFKAYQRGDNERPIWGVKASGARDG